MAKKRRVRAAKVTDRDLLGEKANAACPKCESHVTYCIALAGRAEKYGCRSCGHEWANQAALDSAQRKKVTVMTKVKTAAKKAVEKTLTKKPVTKKATKKTARTDGKTIASVIAAELKKNAAVETADVLAAVKKAFPNAATTPSCVSWYRWKLGIKKPIKAKDTVAKNEEASTEK